MTTTNNADGRRLSARENSPSASNSLIFNESTKQWFSAIIMALSMCLNIVLSVALYRQFGDMKQSEDLRRYDLDFFKQNDWATLKVQIEVQQELIKAYGLQKQVKEK